MKRLRRERNAVQQMEESVTSEQGSGQGIVLKDQVRIAVEQYFTQLDGQMVAGLHAMVIAEVEKPLLETVLNHTGGNQSKAAQVLGMSRSTLRKKMQSYGIE